MKIDSFNGKTPQNSFIKRHVHVPTCTWGTWSENMECRGDTHGADSVVRTQRNSTLKTYRKLIEIMTDRLTVSVTD